MKVSTLFKIFVKEFKKDIVTSVLLLIIVDFVYANFTGALPDSESGMILWQGGNDNYPLNLSTILLKLINISVVFLTVGKITDKISSDIMIYILARLKNYKEFMYAYSIVVIMLGEILLAASHFVYYCFAGFCVEQAISSLNYFFLDGLGFFGIILIYIILNNCYLLENSFVYIIAVYILNTVLPVPILLAMSTVRFFILKSQVTLVPLFLLLVGMDLTVAAFYCQLIKRRRIMVC